MIHTYNVSELSKVLLILNIKLFFLIDYIKKIYISKYYFPINFNSILSKV